MKISIIIPIYMVSDYIEECLLSALNQTYEELEIVCINDATQDDSFIKALAIIQGHHRKDNVKTVVHPVNKGLSAARNSGIKASTGEYLFFLDSDDTLPLNAIETLASQIKDSKTDCVAGDYNRDILPDQDHQTNNSRQDKIVLEGKSIANSLFAKEINIMSCNKLIHRDVFFKHNNWFHEGLLHEDILWTFKFALIIQKLIILPDITYHYRIRENSITQKKKEKNFTDLAFINSEIDRKSLQMDTKSYPDFSSFSLNLKIYILKEIVKSNYGTTFYDRIRKSLFTPSCLKFYVSNASIKNLLILFILSVPGFFSKFLVRLIVKISRQAD